MFYKLCPLILLVGKSPNNLQLESSLACVGIIGSKKIPQLSLLSLAIGMLHLSLFLRKYTLTCGTDWKTNSSNFFFHHCKLIYSKCVFWFIHIIDSQKKKRETTQIFFFVSISKTFSWAFVMSSKLCLWVHINKVDRKSVV